MSIHSKCSVKKSVMSLINNDSFTKVSDFIPTCVSPLFLYSGAQGKKNLLVEIYIDIYSRHC